MNVRRPGPSVLFLGGLLLLLGALNLDLLSGRSTPFFRDLGATQRPAHALWSRLGPSALNPHASFGQPYWGNPNLVLAYPFPRAPRFLGLHLFLHLGLGIVGAYVLFRRLVRSQVAAAFGALAFGLSGYVLSSAAFLNATTTIAWMPWLLVALLAARRTDGRRVLLSGMGVAVSTALLVLGGEPALAGQALLLAAIVALLGPDRRARLLAFVGGGAFAALITVPWLLEALRVTAFSSRRVRGFSWAEFAAVGFHPARFFETPFPFLFGDPSRLLSGGFWGFSVTQGNPPYLASLSFGMLPAVFALLLVVSARRYEGLFWIAVAGGSLLFSFVPWLPGARAIYESAPFLHFLRYPMKSLLLFTLALAALGAIAVDRFLVEEALPRFRSRAALALLVLASLFAIGALAGRVRPDLIERALLTRWDPAWRSDARVVLAPIVARLPRQAALAAAALVLGAVLLKRGVRDARGALLLLAATAAGGLAGTSALFLRAPSAWYDTPSPLVRSAAAIPGRVFERAGKDLDAVRRGLLGRDVDDITSVALAQARQGWALAGAPLGLEYAYDHDPDGSYSYLNRVAVDLLAARGWERRLKWLRAAGVGSILASDVPPDAPGLAPVAFEAAVGLPVTLFRIQAPLPGLRRASRILPVSSISEAIARFEEDRFDPATDVTIFGRNAAALASSRVDPSARARFLEEKADVLVAETSGDAPGVLHVDRSFTPRVTASVEEHPVVPLVADVHLIGIPVPAGRSRVRIDLAP